MTPYPFYNPNMPVGMNEDSQQPYGAQNTAPQSIMQNPQMMQQNSLQSSPFPSIFGTRPTYARGGRVSPMSKMAEHLRSRGQGYDSILAHISPEEAMELEQRHGGNINPETGLPQYGFWENALPVLASIAGGLIAGPFGAIGAGALTQGVISAGDSDTPLQSGLMGGLRGAGTGALTGLGMGALGHAGALGAGGAGTIGGMFGVGTGKIAGLSGLLGSGASKAGAARAAAMSSLKGLGSGRTAAMAGLGKLAGTAAPTGVKGALTGLGSKAASLLNNTSLLDKGLLGTAILGSLGGKTSEEQPRKMYEDNDKVLSQPSWRPDQMPANVGPLSRQFHAHPNEFNAGMMPEHQYFAEGGRYYTGAEGGQADNINARVSPGEYVWDADVVSALGDGNSEAGAKILDKARSRIRSHKRSASPNTIPPKAKSLSHYMFGSKK